MMLHAWQLSFTHPIEKTPCHFVAPPPSWADGFHF
jgi:23S rRNA-/tRNA-specific pseudouridylate synthase